jgi:hypothetical protein
LAFLAFNGINNFRIIRGRFLFDPHLQHQIFWTEVVASASWLRSLDRRLMIAYCQVAVSGDVANLQPPADAATGSSDGTLL